MCYSALVRQNLTWLAKRYGAEVAWELFQELFRRRVDDDGIAFSRSLDVHVMQMTDEAARPSQNYIEQYRAKQARVWEQELFKQRKRLVDAQRKLSIKETKAARNDERIATEKMAALATKLSTLHSEHIVGDDSRIFPKKYYVPIVTNDGGRLLIRPMRYLCRLPGKPASYDDLYKGCYNARRDNLNGFWAGLYGKNHGIMVVDSFFENVPRHLYEKRELAPGERESNVVLNFNPNTGVPMTIACLWSHWTHPRDPELYSFAAITDEPPPEILATGHTRCIVSLKEDNVREWLIPEQTSKERFEAILSDRVTPILRASHRRLAIMSIAPIKILLQTTIPTTADDWSIARFSLLTRHLGDQRDTAGSPVFAVTARDRDPLGAPDRVLAKLDASNFEQLWLFAVDVGNGLTTEDCEGISRFRRSGGGLLVTRDHMDLGSSVCTLGGVGKAHYFHSRNLGPDPTQREIDDPYTKAISWPNFHSGANGDFQTIAPSGAVHPVLADPQSPTGAIRYLPSHPHEGAVGAPEGESARVIATGTSKVTGRRFNIAVAFEPGSGNGPAIAQSTFHHFVDYNWDTRSGAPSFVSEPPGDALLRTPQALADTHRYATNIARWLSPSPRHR